MAKINKDIYILIYTDASGGPVLADVAVDGKGTVTADAKVIAKVLAEFVANGAGSLQADLSAYTVVSVLGEASLNGKGNLAAILTPIVQYQVGDYRITVSGDNSVVVPVEDGLEFTNTETITDTQLANSYSSFLEIQGIDVFGAGPED